ncbi:MAG TPA: hypothetical protein VK559_11365 [Ferruginibacter sp.]|nr:hypothetical protein [Ferruginibacter sp.]
MYPAKPGLTIAFHGCDEQVRDDVVSHKSMLTFKKNPYDWLGNGMYFWENNQQRALDFATELHLSPRRNSPVVKVPSVIGAVIDLGFCLDLMDGEYIKLIQESHGTLLDSFKTLDIKMPVNRDAKGSQDLLMRDLDCAVIENLHLQRKKNKLNPFDSARGLFVEGGQVYEGAGFHKKNHIQICIRNPNCIKGFFIPRLSDNKYPIP